ncbi:MAG: hypothetical protein PVF47_15440 [Anaerolineae bacterium]|jgi:pimeloyl-ACP methyl ester carboxylesterase
MKKAIVIVGGHNSWWPLYLKPARDLEAVSGLPAIGVPLMPWHWWQANRATDASNILEKVSETVAWAGRKYGAERFVLVGHSAGGLIARLYLCEEPVWGRVYGGVAQTSALITLGSPHCSRRNGEVGWYLADAANRRAPGTPYADRIRYRTVAGRSILGRTNGSYRARRAHRAYRFLAGEGALWGDGIVPVRCTTLEGAEQLTLEGVGHSLKTGRNWYAGSRDRIRDWWPAGAGDGD